MEEEKFTGTSKEFMNKYQYRIVWNAHLQAYQIKEEKPKEPVDWTDVDTIELWSDRVHVFCNTAVNPIKFVKITRDLYNEFTRNMAISLDENKITKIMGLKVKVIDEEKKTLSDKLIPNWAKFIDDISNIEATINEGKLGIDFVEEKCHVEQIGFCCLEKDIKEFLINLKIEILRIEKLFPHDWIGKYTLDILDTIKELAGNKLIEED